MTFVVLSAVFAFWLLERSAKQRAAEILYWERKIQQQAAVTRYADADFPWKATTLQVGTTWVNPVDPKVH